MEPRDLHARSHNDLLHFTLKVLALYQVGYIVVVVVIFPSFPALATPILLLQGLVALGQLPQTCQTVRTELIQDPGDQLGEFLVLAVAIDGECVGGD